MARVCSAVRNPSSSEAISCRASLLTPLPSLKHEFDDLRQRIAMELFELYATRPELRRCRLCKRVFVPRGRSETFCRSQLWRSGDPIAFELCLPGDPSAVAKDYNAVVPLADHQRERKTRHRKWRRELARAGGDATNKRVMRAKADYDVWIEQHGRTRGPKRHPEQQADHVAAPPQPEKEKR